MNKYLFLILSILMLILNGCREDDFRANQQLKPVSFKVLVSYDQSYGTAKVHNALVSLTNIETKQKIEKTTDKNGELNLTGVLPGEYNISVQQTFTAETFLKTFGYNLTGQDEITFNGNQEKVIINANTTSTSIVLKTGKIGNLVLKQIYYSGSDVKRGAIFRDQFVEIYNNSNEILYADGLYFAQLKGNNNTKTTIFTLPNGQFDWSKSDSNEIGNKANTDYVYASYVIRIPGSGTQYPIKPGESVVIAATAINHKEPFTDNNGKSVSIEDPNLTVDLSKANFEGYLGNYRKSIGQDVYIQDIDNPNVPDVEIAFWGDGSKDFLLNPQGRESFVIFRATNEQFSSFAKRYLPNKAQNRQYLRIPNSIITDAVETNLFNEGRPKQLSTSLDSQYVFDPFGAYSSFAIYRKVSKTINGRVILQDTNNSKNDFEVKKANPKGF